MEHQAPLQIFTITQLELGSPLIWEPAVGTVEHDRLVDAYIPGPANLQQKRATIALDFFDTAAASTMPAPFCRTYLVATSTPEFAAKPYSPAFAPTTSFSPSTSSTFSASTSSLSSKSSKRSISSLSSAASASPAKRLPGFSIMTADGVDITNNQSRGPKTKAQREQAAKMRKLGACPACKRSKQKCEPSHHRPAPMSASSSQNASSVSSPWQSSGSASASTSPGSRASISPQTSFGQSFSPASQAPMAAADLAWNFAAPAGDFVLGDWAFTSDQLLAANSNVPGLFPSDLLDLDALDEDFFAPAPASADNFFPHVQDRPNVQPRGFEGGAWYDDFVLSSYFNGGEADASLSSAQASVGESSARTQASSVSTSPSGQTDSSHVLGGLERVRDLSPTSSSSEIGGSSRSPELDLFRDRSVHASELVVNGTLWDNLQSDSSSPTHDPRTATPTLQRQSSDGIVDDPSDPDPVPWAVPPNTTSTTPRRQTRVTSKQIRAPTSRANPMAHAVPYITDLCVSDEGDLPPSHAMAQAMATNQHQRLEYLKVLRDSRRDLATGSHRLPSASASSVPLERDTQLRAAVARSLVSSSRATSASSVSLDRTTQLHAAVANYLVSSPPSASAPSVPSERNTQLQAAVARSLISSSPTTTASSVSLDRTTQLHAAVARNLASSSPSAFASSVPLERNTQLHAAVARYIASSSLSTPYSPPAAASGEDGLGECRDRHKAVRKPVALCSCTVSTAVPATALCACTPTSPTKTIPANLVAPPSRLSTGVLGGMLDGIRRRVLSFFGAGDAGVEGLVWGMGRLGVGIGLVGAVAGWVRGPDHLDGGDGAKSLGEEELGEVADHDGAGHVDCVGGVEDGYALSVARQVGVLIRSGIYKRGEAPTSISGQPLEALK
ncbi:hypothetical protein V501_03164 [Pseudogymnoascus sp. VKM F-4519 (FW-2642)]|nr:hypothetical protein V501_03164 [Pseudogymnoascus sp. VKM F-4519 (FW-2642)]